MTDYETVQLACRQYPSCSTNDLPTDVARCFTFADGGGSLPTFLPDSLHSHSQQQPVESVSCHCSFKKLCSITIICPLPQLFPLDSPTSYLDNPPVLVVSSLSLSCFISLIQTLLRHPHPYLSPPFSGTLSAPTNSPPPHLSPSHPITLLPHIPQHLPPSGAVPSITSHQITQNRSHTNSMSPLPLCPRSFQRSFSKR